MKTLTKHRVDNIISGYRELFPREYDLAARLVRSRSATQKRWGEAGSDLGREVTRMPEALQMSLKTQLTSEQYDELYSKKGLLWFLRKYPEWNPNQEQE